MRSSGNESFDRTAAEIHVHHRSQTLEDVTRLNLKYQEPAIGTLRVGEALTMLKTVVDPTDKELYTVSQWDHIRQVIGMMEQEGVISEEFLIMGLVHDLGKVLLTLHEEPSNIVCDNFAIGTYPDGIGLDNVTFQWNHDEFGYMRLKGHLPPHMARLIRYHSINPSVLRYMSVADKRFHGKYLEPFRRYDKLSKSPHVVPEIDEDKYLRMLDKWFPDPIVI